MKLMRIKLLRMFFLVFEADPSCAKYSAFFSCLTVAGEEILSDLDSPLTCVPEGSFGCHETRNP